MKELPNIYKNNNFNPSFHNRDFCYVMERGDIEKQIDQIFDSLGPISKKKVFIETVDRTFSTFLYKRTNRYLITIQDEKILIDDILSIRRVS